jgi:hypothetical protein
LNFEQLISSCNLEVKLEASSLVFFFFCLLQAVSIENLTRSLCFSAVLLTKFSVQLHRCLT